MIAFWDQDWYSISKMVFFPNCWSMVIIELRVSIKAVIRWCWIKIIILCILSNFQVALNNFTLMKVIVFSGLSSSWGNKSWSCVILFSHPYVFQSGKCYDNMDLKQFSMSLLQITIVIYQLCHKENGMIFSQIKRFTVVRWIVQFFATIFSIHFINFEWILIAVEKKKKTKELAM